MRLFFFGWLVCVEDVYPSTIVGFVCLLECVTMDVVGFFVLYWIGVLCFVQK